MFRPWLKSLSYVTAQSLAKLKTLVGFPASFKLTGGAHGQQAHWDFVHRQYEFVWKATLPTYSQCLEDDLLNVVVVMAPNVLSEVLDW